MRLSKSESDIFSVSSSEKFECFPRLALSSTPNFFPEMQETTADFRVVHIEMMNTSSISTFSLASVTNNTDGYSTDDEDKSPLKKLRRSSHDDSLTSEMQH
jgi:hypothetical protein